MAAEAEDMDAWEAEEEMPDGSGQWGMGALSHGSIVPWTHRAIHP